MRIATRWDARTRPGGGGGIRRSAGGILRPASALAIAAALAALAGCGRHTTTALFTFNQPPVLRLTAGPTSPTDALHYRVTLRWTAFDPDGRIERYEYAVDPHTAAGGETTWVATPYPSVTLVFATPVPDTVAPRPSVTANAFHSVAVRAVDDRGATSNMEARAFFSMNVAPTVRITVPQLPSPGSLFPGGGPWRSLPSGATITFEGLDEDGPGDRLPAEFRWIQINDTTGVKTSDLQAGSAMDTIRRYYAPRDWEGWQRLPGTARQLVLPDPPGSIAELAIVALDEAGAYSPFFSMSQNVLFYRRSSSGVTVGPRITISLGSAGSFQTRADSCAHPAWPAVEVASGLAFKATWEASPFAGSQVVVYCHAVDAADPCGDAGWSPWDSQGRSAVLGPFAPGEVHTLHVRARDEMGLTSIAGLTLRSIQGARDRPLLIVDDTRLAPDQLAPGTGCVQPPSGRWPTAAELDTFLFARGGLPWRCYPAGTTSEPGLFAGYDYDTLGTRNGLADPSVPLETLLRYRHVVWITDRLGATYTDPGTGARPQSALAYMSEPNRVNTLAQYVAAGGKLWLLGGGAAAATVIYYDRHNNNNTPPAPCETYSSTNFELTPGRFVYDLAKWRSEVKVLESPVQIVRQLGRNGDRGPYQTALLPDRLLPHSEAAGDAYPPNRDPARRDEFYYTSMFLEYLSRPNDYREDVDPGPAEDFRSALDTLYAGVGSRLMPASENRHNVAMAVYPSHERDPSAALVMSGFDLWSWRRPQCRQLVDFVLQHLWGLTPAPAAVRH